MRRLALLAAILALPALAHSQTTQVGCYNLIGAPQTVATLQGSDCWQGAVHYFFPSSNFMTCTSTGTGICPTTAQVRLIQDIAGEPATILWQLAWNNGGTCSKTTPQNCVGVCDNAREIPPCNVTITFNFFVQNQIKQGNLGHGLLTLGAGTVSLVTISNSLSSSVLCNSTGGGGFTNCSGGPMDANAANTANYTNGYYAVTQTWTATTTSSSDDAADVQRVLTAPALPDSWKEYFRERLARVSGLEMRNLENPVQQRG